MEVRIDSLLSGAERATGSVVIIDVFRAFTTAAVVLARGGEPRRSLAARKAASPAARAMIMVSSHTEREGSFVLSESGEHSAAAMSRRNLHSLLW